MIRSQLKVSVVPSLDRNHTAVHPKPTKNVASPPLPTHLITASTAGLLAVAVVTATVQLPLLPEVDHVHQQLAALAADEAGRVPQLVVAGALGVHRRLAATHGQLAMAARLRRGGEERERVLGFIPVY